MAEVINVPVDSLNDGGHDRNDNNKSSDDPDSPPPPPPPPPRRREKDSRERRDDRDLDRPPNRRGGGDYYDRNRSPPPPPPRERDYKRRASPSPPPPYRDRRAHSPPRRSPPIPPFKRSRRDDGGYDGRRGSPRGGYGHGSRRFGYDYPYEREGGRPGYSDERLHGQYAGRSSGGYPSGSSDWDSGRDGYNDASNTGNTKRGPGVNTLSSNKSGQTSDPNSDDDTDVNGKRRRHGRAPAKETDLLSDAPKAHPVSSEPRRIQLDIEQAQALLRKLDSEKGIEDNILSKVDNDRMTRDKPHGSSSGPVIIVRGLTSVKGLEGTELLDTLITYLWRIHGVDYYGLVETRDPKGLRHVRIDGKSSDGPSNGAEWEKKLDSRWQERLRGQDPLEVMTAKEKIDATAVEALDPYVRKIRDEKYGWKYGCGAKGCTKLFHAAEFVNKHLKLKHPDLVMELTSKVREDLYFQNYMNDADAPGGTPVMQPSIQKEKPQRRRPGLENRLKDERGSRRERDNRDNGNVRYDRSEKPQSMDFQSNNDGPGGGNPDELMFDSFGGQGLHVAPSFSSDIPPPVLMPVPGAGPLGPFVPAPPEVAMQMLREQGGPSPFEGGGRNGRSGPQLSGPAPIIALPQAFRQDPRRLRSYQDLDAPEDEVTVIDYRSL
ncbi:Serrate RNA effector molecule like [Actinidia chinensis var. chinensis]|uniref:Serrate RNA effector molecule like n=1 Tax=Actinidia chinensis var. chinensis TaxID=1590841 RepID=A0A2R6QTV5_ACTCC|nr:Serrate RNA effector molecule like [Actinidia chinensis var. chinensis]